ncbi:hypothetical protein [Streptomyces sp. SP18CS02]|uniref:hypothetical protein n=1 Tax=Streptomyces sp. SP18CS02 TaxID=3002531 RepID=UPI002E77C2CE|nr:hypothetical protein [Streptomyces sp. SP18CS02]MEE1755212.1 hypothetical protein [Streptomyces sp. SP18CS02]
MIVVAGVALGLALLLPRGEEPARTPEEAKRLVARVAAGPEEWGAGFAAGDESYELGEEALREDCQIISRADRPGTLVSYRRLVSKAQPVMEGHSEVRVFKDAATARAFVADAEDAVHRCATQRSGAERYGNIREGVTEQLTGFDEVVAEIGASLIDTYGKKTDERYTRVTGLMGDTVLAVQMFGPADMATDNNALTTATIQRMQKRLQAER